MILHVVLFSLFLLVVIAWDMRTFEIDFAALAMVALNGLCLNLYLGVSSEDMAAGAVIWAVAFFLVRWILGRNAIGQGDLWLLLVMGMIAGLSGALVALTAFAVLGLVTSKGYAIARGRPKRRFSVYPAAIPGGLTIFLMFALRFAGIDPSLTDAAVSLGRVSAFNAELRAFTAIWGVPIAVLSAIAAVGWMILDRRSAPHPQNRSIGALDNSGPQVFGSHSKHRRQS